MKQIDKTKNTWNRNENGNGPYVGRYLAFTFE